MERFPGKYRYLYASGLDGRPMSVTGHSGAWVRAEERVIGYIFGGGFAEKVRLESSWILDLNEVCSRVRSKWGGGRQICVY